MISFKDTLPVTQGPLLKTHLLWFPPLPIINTLGTMASKTKTFEKHISEPQAPYLRMPENKSNQ